MTPASHLAVGDVALRSHRSTDMELSGRLPKIPPPRPVASSAACQRRPHVGTEYPVPENHFIM
jgi:hypothetical protein